MLDYAARSLSEFNKYEAIEFYCLMYQTARGKVDLPKENFRVLVLRLVGDKDHTKVYEAVAKVGNAMGTGHPWSGSSQRERMRSSALVQCYFCGKFGHIVGRCYARMDMQQRPPVTRDRTRDNKQ